MIDNSAGERRQSVLYSASIFRKNLIAIEMSYFCIEISETG